MFDELCLTIVEKNINMTVPWYLMAALAYYEEDDPILEDTTFDALAKTMLGSWDQIEHSHKELITEGDLRAGTLLIKSFPPRVKGGLRELRKLNQPKTGIKKWIKKK